MVHDGKCIMSASAAGHLLVAMGQRLQHPDAVRKITQLHGRADLAQVLHRLRGATAQTM